MYLITCNHQKSHCRPKGRKNNTWKKYSSCIILSCTCKSHNFRYKAGETNKTEAENLILFLYMCASLWLQKITWGYLRGAWRTFSNIVLKTLLKVYFFPLRCRRGKTSISLGHGKHNLQLTNKIFPNNGVLVKSFAAILPTWTENYGSEVEEIVKKSVTSQRKYRRTQCLSKIHK